jgi:PIN domain nuclease of toxin-antitoxin system
MKYLIDTNIFLWYAGKSDLLNADIYDLIIDNKNDIYMSIAAFWEIAIKKSIGKLDVSRSVNDFIYESKLNGFFTLPISDETIAIIESLPFHHKDPFDRMIIAQGIANNFKIITSDISFLKYDVNVILNK